MKASNTPKPAVFVKDLQSRIRISRGRINGIVMSVLEGEGVCAGGEITVCLVDDRRIREMNRRFHGSDRATDVLAFELGTGEGFLSDIVISTDTAAANSARYRTSATYESCLYLIHGTLHLLGYGDKTPRQRACMRAKESLYLRKLGLKKG